MNKQPRAFLGRRDVENLLEELQRKRELRDARRQGRGREEGKGGERGGPEEERRMKGKEKKQRGEV